MKRHLIVAVLLAVIITGAIGYWIRVKEINSQFPSVTEEVAALGESLQYDDFSITVLASQLYPKNEADQFTDGLELPRDAGNTTYNLLVVDVSIHNAGDTPSKFGWENMMAQSDLWSQALMFSTVDAFNPDLAAHSLIQPHETLHIRIPYLLWSDSFADTNYLDRQYDLVLLHYPNLYTWHIPHWS